MCVCVCVCVGVFVYGEFLDSHVVIWMLQFTDIVSSDVAIVGAIEQCKSQHKRSEKKSDTKAAVKTTTAKKSITTNDEWKIHRTREGKNEEHARH